MNCTTLAGLAASTGLVAASQPGLVRSTSSHRDDGPTLALDDPRRRLELTRCQRIEPARKQAGDGDVPVARHAVSRTGEGPEPQRIDEKRPTPLILTLDRP